MSFFSKSLSPKAAAWALLILPVILVVFVVFWWAATHTVSEQHGYRGTGIQTISSKNKQMVPVPAVRPHTEAAADEQTAGEMYVNVQIPALRAMRMTEFNDFMEQITDWVNSGASEANRCFYCHVDDGNDIDAPYTKEVARRMIEMVQDLNTNWSSHLVNSKVTCYTCHRGQPIPANLWYTEPANTKVGLGNLHGQNKPAPGDTAMYVDPYTPFLVKQDDPKAIRVMGTNQWPVKGETGKSLHDTERTYSLMMAISEGLGVNCTYCHNSQNFADWAISRPQRALAWQGLAMVRSINVDHMVPMQPVFSTLFSSHEVENVDWRYHPGGPEKALAYSKTRLGPAGDSPKVVCATCHNGEPIPLNRADLVSTYPALLQAPAPRVLPAPHTDDAKPDAASK